MVELISSLSLLYLRRFKGGQLSIYLSTDRRQLKFNVSVKFFVIIYPSDETVDDDVTSDDQPISSESDDAQTPGKDTTLTFCAIAYIP